MQNYNEDERMKLQSNPKTIASGKVANGFTTGPALERPPLGAFVGGSPRPDPDEGTTEDFGLVAAPPA